MCMPHHQINVYVGSLCLATSNDCSYFLQSTTNDTLLVPHLMKCIEFGFPNWSSDPFNFFWCYEKKVNGSLAMLINLSMWVPALQEQKRASIFRSIIVLYKTKYNTEKEKGAEIASLGELFACP